MVWEVRERPAALFEPVAEGWPRVLHQLGRDGRGADGPRLTGHLAELRPRRYVAEMHREERRCEERRHPLFQPFQRRRRAPDAELHLRIPERREEPEPFDVVCVQMRDQQIDLRRVDARERHPVGADPGAGVEDHHRPVIEVEHDAGGLSAVADRLGAWGGEGASAAPDRRAHR